MPSAREWIGYAESVEEALKRGLKKLGLTRDDVQMDILSERTSSLFSMMDYRRVRVKLTPKPGAEPAARPQRPDDRRRRDERPGRRPEREKNFEGRGDRRDQSFPRGNDRRDDRRDDRRENRRNAPGQKPFGGRDQRRDNPDRRRGDQNRDRDRNRPPQDRPQENRRPNPPFRDRPRQGNPNAQRPPSPGRPPEQSPQAADDFKRPFPTGAAPENISAAPEPSSPAREAAPPFDAAAVENHLNRWKEWLGWEDLAWSVKPEAGRRIPVQLSTAKNDRLMGPRGETLQAFEYLFNLVLTQSAKDAPAIQFSMEGVDNPKEQRILDLAKLAAAEVRRSRSVYRMDPMPPADRKIVHQALANEADIETVSEGEGPYRKVVVRPRTGAPAPRKPSPWVR